MVYQVEADLAERARLRTECYGVAVFALATLWRRLVRARGLEPLILTEPDPKSGASANSATRASSRVSRFMFRVSSGKFSRMELGTRKFFL